MPWQCCTSCRQVWMWMWSSPACESSSTPQNASCSICWTYLSTMAGWLTPRWDLFSFIIIIYTVASARQRRTDVRRSSFWLNFIVPEGLISLISSPWCQTFPSALVHFYHFCISFQMRDIVKAVGNCSYNQLVEKIISCKQSDNSELAGEGEHPTPLLSLPFFDFTWHFCTSKAELLGPLMTPLRYTGLRKGN